MSTGKTPRQPRWKPFTELKSEPSSPLSGLYLLEGVPVTGVRGRYGDLGGVSGRVGFRVSVGARERDRQLGGLSPVLPCW